MTNSVVRIVVGTLMLAGAAAGAAGAPQPSTAAEQLSRGLSGPAYVAAIAAALALAFGLVLLRHRAADPTYVGRHRA